jgi:branched-chain amino acid transport system permease protein
MPLDGKMRKPLNARRTAGRHVVAAAAMLVGSTAPVLAAEAAGVSRDLAYFLQQCLNAAVVSSFYALLGVAYALVYGLTGRIVLAFGDFATYGAYVAVLAILVLFELARFDLGAALFAAGAITVGATAALGVASQSLVFRPLFGRASQAMLVASIGVAIVVQEVIRMATGGRELWLPPVLTEAYLLVASDGFSVQITAMQAAIVTSSALLSVLLTTVMRRTGFGRSWRACSEDGGLAGLCGVNLPAVVAMTFALSSAYAGVAGFAVAVYYGNVSFYMGLVLGLKALFAAIIGGFGSIGGAIAGAIVLATLETMWSAYFSIEYRDVAVFTVFVLVLILRPQGMVSVAERRDHRV